MAAKLTVLVTGATGKQGGSVARALLDRGHKVRALTRDPTSPPAQALREAGAEVVSGDLLSRRSLTDAAKGVDAVFAVSTFRESGVETEIAQGRAVTDAALAARVPHLLYTSVAAADRHTGIPHFDSKAKIEEYIRESDVPYSVIAPVSFAENLFSPWLLPTLQSGTLAMGLPATKRQQYIGTREIGRFAALVLERRSEFLGKRIEIAMDELTGRDLAELVSREVGRPIRYEALPIATLRLSNPESARMYEWLTDAGYSVDIRGLRRTYPEVGWRTFDQWLREQDLSVLR